MLNKLQNEDHHKAFLSEDSKLDSSSNIKMYTATFLKESDKEKTNRNGKKKGRETNKVLLVYPFDADEDEIDGCRSS
jgi:hypothetical protein